MKIKNLISLLPLAAIVMAGAISCSKDSGSGTPNPGGGNGGNGGNTTTAHLITIQALRNKYTGTGIKLTDSTKIAGTVISDAANKNISTGSVVIQDGSNRGISVYFGGSITYNLGDSIVVDITNDSLISYNGSLEVKAALGATTPAAIATGKTVTPQTMTIAALNTALSSLNAANIEYTLVKLTGTVASPAGTYSGSKTIADLTGSMTLYTATAATFAGQTMPATASTWTGYANSFNSTKELQIRNTNDVIANTGGGPTNSQTSIATLRSMYTGTGIKLGSYKVSGIVISDAGSKNVSSGSVLIQDGNRGISVYFGGTITYSIGDSVVLDVTGDSLINYNGSLEIKTPFGAVAPAPVATGKTVTPQTMTIAQLNTALGTLNPTTGVPDIENTLVKITGATATGTTFSGSQSLGDGSGTIVLYTSSSATFATQALPAGAKTWTGYGVNYRSTTKEFSIRNTSDVQ